MQGVNVAGAPDRCFRCGGFPFVKQRTHATRPPVRGDRQARPPIGAREVGTHQSAGLRAKKHFGQHFLTAPSYAQRIADAVPAASSDHVLEIGAGRGALSLHLQRRFPGFHCIEKDRDLVPILRQALGTGPHTIHEHDVLSFDFAQAGFPLHVTGNLPYSIGAMIIRKTLSYGEQIKSCTFMVQREVAERICASTHTKRNGFLSIFCQFFGRPSILFHLPPGAFRPPPKVESSVFQLVVDDARLNAIPAGEREDFFGFVDVGFSQRRKKLTTVFRNLERGLDLTPFLQQVSLSTDARAEDLGVGDWQRLFEAVRCTTPRRWVRAGQDRMPAE
jgi:16S rRNA (adenine1518-N6/adenine1519-N6)-dimethyltransferase